VRILLRNLFRFQDCFVGAEKRRDAYWAVALLIKLKIFSKDANRWSGYDIY
jgi:hypothetical protein